MNLNLIKLTPDCADRDFFEQLNNEAFPESERMSLEEIFTFAEGTGGDVLGIYDDKKPVGYILLVKNDRCAYIFYLAIDSRARSKGYGGAALKKVYETYPDLQIILDFEIMDGEAENIEQRRRRKSFYLRNGLHETGNYTILRGAKFEVVCNGGTLDTDAFRELIHVIHAHQPAFPDVLEVVENPGRPVGEPGVKTLERMNVCHAPVRQAGFRQVQWKEGMRILDVGCGGGETIAEMLALSKNSQIDGLDHSETAVEQTALRNREYIGTRVQVTAGDVGALPYGEETYDLVTAVETVYFWPDMKKAFEEIHRVLKGGGMFLICCESCDPNVGWPDPFHQIHIYRPAELAEYFKNAGFREIAYEETDDGILSIHGLR